jgi:opacity protein-like surface antigen
MNTVALLAVLAVLVLSALVAAQSPQETAALEELRTAWNLQKVWLGRAKDACAQAWRGLTCSRNNTVIHL